MTKHPDEQQKGPEQSQAAKEEIEKQKQKAEENEVAGRHKNDGKNDHAGHKTNR
ncbi:MAG: hypothetical protein H7315_13330 [Herminiimonas sp.]|nr:hypothetical protein [Herminiimonas sp.]